MIQSRGLGGRRLNAKVFIIVGAVLLVVSSAAAGYFFWQWNMARSNPNLASEETVKRLTDRIGKFYAIPDEKPSVAQVEDKEKLKDQPFFDKSEKGDYLLIYPNAKVAMLYRERENKLINVGPVTINDEQQGQAAGAQTQTPTTQPTANPTQNKTTPPATTTPKKP